jgi:hypothetical protein
MEDQNAVTVLVIPGLSIMERRWLSPRLMIVRCPGCGSTELFSTVAPKATFVHEREDCPILRRVEAALVRATAAGDRAKHN